MRNLYRKSISKGIFYFMIISSLILPSCAPLLLGVGGCATYKTTKIATNRRTLGQQFDDGVGLNLRVSDEVSRICKNYGCKISYNIFIGDVLLVGTAQNEFIVRELVERIRKINGIRDVFNEVEITFMTRKVHQNFFLEKKIRAKIVLENGIKSGNYLTIVKNDIVYVLGCTNSRAEVERVLSVIKSVSGIRKIVNYVFVNCASDGNLER